MNGVVDDCLRVSARDLYANNGSFAEHNTSTIHFTFVYLYKFGEEKEKLNRFLFTVEKIEMRLLNKGVLTNNQSP